MQFASACPVHRIFNCDKFQKITLTPVTTVLLDRYSIRHAGVINFLKSAVILAFGPPCINDCVSFIRTRWIYERLANTAVTIVIVHFLTREYHVLKYTVNHKKVAVHL